MSSNEMFFDHDPISWNLEKVREAIEKTSSCSEALIYLGKTPNRGTKNQLRKLIKLNNISTSHFLHVHLGGYVKNKNITIADFTDKCTWNKTSIKRFLKNNKILDFTICSLCGISDQWNGKKLILQLDHINGNNIDNRIENLRIVCPNCHSQTDTFCNKKNLNKPVISKVDTKKLCDECKKPVKDGHTLCHMCLKHVNLKLCTLCKSPCKSKTAKHCSNCYNAFIKPRKFNITKEELINLINQFPMTKIGQMLGVSDNAVRKRCKFFAIELPLKGRKSKKLRNAELN